MLRRPIISFFSFNNPSTTDIYTLSLHDALPIYRQLRISRLEDWALLRYSGAAKDELSKNEVARSEEHTSELQSHSDLVCRLLLEKKKATRGISRNDCNSAQGYARSVTRHASKAR